MIDKTIENELIIFIKEVLKKTKWVVPLPANIEILLEIPKNKLHGDISTSLALKLAPYFKSQPGDLAQKISQHLNQYLDKSKLKEKIDKIEVKHPGFINFFLKIGAVNNILWQIKKEGSKFGLSQIGKGEKVQIEFVSANPTGPLSIAHGRQAAVGDSLANLFQFCGYKVTKEYYLNDEGRQINLLGQSIYARYLELLGQKSQFPQDGYQGEYIIDLAQEVVKKYGKKFIKPNQKMAEFFSSYGSQAILKIIKRDLKDFGVNFDVWFSQAHLRESGQIEKALKDLEVKGIVYNLDSALWFNSTKWGDDKDRVVVKSDGSYTYLAPDIAYHKNKYQRGFEQIINIWGPDHHGYIPRLKAAVAALGHDPKSLSILIVQLVTLYKDKVQVPMSTRGGQFVTLRQLIDEVGSEATRLLFLTRKTDSHLDFDLELAKKQSSDNPVYYIQYAHARICSILDFQKTKKVKARLKPDLSLIKEPEEKEIVKKLQQFPLIIEASVNTLEPYRLYLYLHELASAFHYFYTKHRVVSQDKNLTDARLLLADSLRIVLATGLKLLGLKAPQKM